MKYFHQDGGTCQIVKETIGVFHVYFHNHVISRNVDIKKPVCQVRRLTAPSAFVFDFLKDKLNENNL